jgi:hypothetical protein
MGRWIEAKVLGRGVLDRQVGKDLLRSPARAALVHHSDTPGNRAPGSGHGGQPVDLPPYQAEIDQATGFSPSSPAPASRTHPCDCGPMLR